MLLALQLTMLMDLSFAIQLVMLLVILLDISMIMPMTRPLNAMGKKVGVSIWKEDLVVLRAAEALEQREDRLKNRWKKARIKEDPVF